jgi:hypothetical protein
MNIFTSTTKDIVILSSPVFYNTIDNLITNKCENK